METGTAQLWVLIGGSRSAFGTFFMAGSEWQALATGSLDHEGFVRIGRQIDFQPAWPERE